MAKSNNYVTGKSIQDLLNMDFETFDKLSESDMRKVVGRFVSAGNKRIRSFENAGETSPAIRNVMRSGGVLSTRGKDLNALRSEFTRAKTFLQAVTSTRLGWKQTKTATIKSLKKQGVEIDVNQFDTFWDAYEKLREIDPEISARGLKYKIMQEMSDEIADNDISVDDLVEKMHNRITDIYEQEEGLDDDFDDVSDFFEI